MGFRSLFMSIRDQEARWRLYVAEVILCIKIIALLWKIDIPLKDIKIIMDIKNLKIVESVIKNWQLEWRGELIYTMMLFDS
jgi:DNA-binding transcriptional MerR regulator